MREELPNRRKSNRIETVEVLPSRTERGDMVHIHYPTHAYLREKRENLNQSHSLG